MAVQAHFVVTRTNRPVRKGTPRAVRRARTLAIFFVLLVAAFVLLFPRSVHTQAHDGRAQGVTYTVVAGDTLWEIAARHAGRRDIREVIYRIEQANGLTSPQIEPGQVLFVPTAGGSVLAGR